LTPTATGAIFDLPWIQKCDLLTRWRLVVRIGGEWKIIDSQNTDIIEGVLAPPQQSQRN